MYVRCINRIKTWKISLFITDNCFTSMGLMCCGDEQVELLFQGGVPVSGQESRLWRPWAAAYTARYTLYDTLSWEVSVRRCCSLSRDSVPLQGGIDTFWRDRLSGAELETFDGREYADRGVACDPVAPRLLANSFSQNSLKNSSSGRWFGFKPLR